MLCFIICSCLWFQFFFLKKIKLKLELNVPEHIRNEPDQKCALYYDLGNGFNENDVHKFFYRDYQESNIKIELALPYRNLKGIRFDPLNGQGTITIKKLFLNGHALSFKDLLDDGSLIPMHSIEGLKIIKHELVISSNAPDPHLLLLNEIPESYSQSNYISNFFNIKSELILTLKVPDDLRKDQAGIYFDTGNGFNEKEMIVFPYHQYSQKKIIKLNAVLPGRSLKCIRFDPLEGSGQVIITKIRFNNRELSLKDLLYSGNLLGLNSIEDIKLHNNELVINCNGPDPYLYVLKNIPAPEENSFLNIVMILFLILSCCFSLGLYKLLHFFFYKGSPGSLILFEHKPIYFVFAMYLLLLITIIFSKSMVLSLVFFYFKRGLGIDDLLFTYLSDLPIALAFGFFIVLITFVCHKIRHKIVRYSIYSVALVHGFIMLILALFYLLSSYIFSEWGAFVEVHHIEAVMMTNVNNEIYDLLLRWHTLISLIILLCFVVLMVKFFQYLKCVRPVWVLTIPTAAFLPVALLALIPLTWPQNFAPSTQSPVYMMLQSQSGNSDGVQKKLLENIDSKNFAIRFQKNIKPQYIHYQGLAKNYNIIILVLESVRQANIGLYGYHRPTMPFLKTMATNSIVCYNAFVNQPRSCKTLASLILGVYPDPRLVALTWRNSSLGNKNNLLQIMLDQGYGFYYGNLQSNYGGDGFQPFLKKITNDRITHITGREQLKAQIKSSYPDDRLIIQDFLSWSKEQENPFVAMIWTQSAHSPYSSPITPYGEETSVDKYDNCLMNLNTALQDLVTGLEAQTKLDQTLIVILGDHGEAVGKEFDWGHGNYLYNYSVKVPFIIYNKKLFSERINMYQRFQMKDIPATLLFLTGLPNTMEQSINIFTKSKTDRIFLCNVFQDYKLGMIFDHYKFVFRPKYDLSYLYDLRTDPEELNNIITDKNAEEIAVMKKETLQWYKYQIEYLNKKILKFSKN